MSIDIYKMLPEIWGEYGWKFLHLVTMGYPINPTDEDKEHYYQYMTDLKYVLPCKKCRYHMASHLKKYPLTEEVMSCRKNFVRWGIDLHNVVNYYTGKPMLTYDEAMNEINKLMHPQKSDNNWFYYLLLIIIILVVCYFIYYYYQKK
jgi:hypothetical protein